MRHILVTKIFLLYLIITIFGCNSNKEQKSDNVIEEKVMIEIIKDLKILDAAQKSFVTGSIEGKMMRDTSYTIVFNKYNTNAEQFDSSLRSYARNPKILAQLMDEVGKKINRY
ncbi:MAG: DUF4296 domain-containing protein [Bacteroidia bacterium]|nr:DUF4296 domain-containing protein [Bacteroidia bacterium]